MTTGPAGRHSTSGGCAARSPTAANRRRSRSVGAGSWSGPTPGSTTSASFSAAPSDAGTASTPTSPWPPPSSRSVPCCGPPGTATAGTPGQDHHASADLLADALSNRHCARRRPLWPQWPSLGHAQDGLDDGAAVRGLDGVLDVLQREVLDQAVEGEPPLGVQVHERRNQVLAVPAAAEGAADRLAPQRGQVVGAELGPRRGAADEQGGPEHAD